MELYGLSARSNFIGNTRIHAFHAEMFHGLAERDGREHPHDTPVYANTPSPSPLVISRSATRIPDISKPSRHLVVSEAIAVSLRSIPGIRLVQVRFRRLVDIDYAAGVFGYQDKWGIVDPRVLLRKRPDIPAFHERIGSYFEVQACRHYDVIGEYQNTTDVVVESGTPPLVSVDTLKVSLELFDDYPILLWGQILMKATVFRLLDEGIDRDYFIVRKFQVE